MIVLGHPGRLPFICQRGMSPYGGYAEAPARIFEGTDEIDLNKKESRPSGSSEKGTYFWKMTQDKRFIEVT